MLTYILLLLCIPVVVAFLFLIGKGNTYYKFLSIAMCAAGTIISILLMLQGVNTHVQVSGTLLTTFEGIITVGEVFIILYLLYVSIKHKRWNVLALVVIQIGLTIYSELYVAKSEQIFFNVDKLSIVMALIVNIVGTLILVFANGYITHYEEHRHMKSRQKLFYFVICIFLSAMNGLVLSDSLSWMYFFWEITTLSSFLLISYNNDEEALNSGFRALFLNIIGGIAFSAGIIIFSKMDVNGHGIYSLNDILASNSSVKILLPVFLLCLAGFAKSAQMPFHSWLLGAMVAPTPVSALLHSSTMVKAGVFLIIKLAPAYAGTWLGTAIAIYGGFTFVVCSAIAVSQRNAKRVLAYSTIANLGLIILSAGIGSSVAISASIMLLIFHAISKALLFLCTGQVEHTIGSRDIEDMEGLVEKAPMLTALLALGMLSMLLPPFGVLITKWIAIEAAAANPLLAIMLVLGSALTTVYYVKWLGTIFGAPGYKFKPKWNVDATIVFPLMTLGTLIIVTSIFINQIFDYFVSDEVSELIRKGATDLTLGVGRIESNAGEFAFGFVILVLIIVLIAILFAKKVIFPDNVKRIYMCGENNNPEDQGEFRTGTGALSKAKVSNLYLTRFISETKLTNFGYVISVMIILVAFIGGLR